MESFTIWANRRLRLLLTEECNIDCCYCHNEGQPKGHAYLPQDLFAHVLRVISFTSDSIAAVTFTGGEPLLHPDLVHFVAELSPFTRERVLVTNGWLLTDDKLGDLMSAGLTKVRLGVDSLSKGKSRPTTGSGPARPIRDIIGMILDRKIPLELNIVLSKFNMCEVGELLSFCQSFRLSAKFFELARPEAIWQKAQGRGLDVDVQVLREIFHSTAMSVLNDVNDECAPGFGEANRIYKANGFSVRYCQYLCPYGLCAKTGTRIDPHGFVYVCMAQRGRYYISPGDSLDESVRLMGAAVQEGCIGEQDA